MPVVREAYGQAAYQVGNPHHFISVDEARRTILAQVRENDREAENGTGTADPSGKARKPGSREEQVELLEARGRVSSRPVFAAGAAPPFDRSPLDGYAFQATDLGLCLDGLRVTGEVVAGHAPGRGPGPGEAWRVATGAPIPPGCDVVARFEDTELRGDVVHIKVPVRSGDNVARRGEDFAIGSLLLPAGVTIRSQHIGLLAAGGHPQVWVSRRPRVALLSTGDELVETGRPLRPGQIWNSNVFALAAAIVEVGGRPVTSGTCPDSVPAIAKSLRRLLVGCRPDLILTTGGASVGERDVCRAAVAELGGRELFWRVAMKPGTPAFAAVLGPRLLIGLSGNPAAALTTFDVLVRPVIAAFLGLEWRPSIVRAVLVNGVGKPSALRRYYRALLTCSGGQWRADVLPGQSPGALSGMARANGLVVVPEGRGPLQSGEQVEAWLTADLTMDGGETFAVDPAHPLASG